MAFIRRDGLGVCLAVFGLVVVSACSSHGGVTGSVRPSERTLDSPRSCALDDLHVGLGHGGLAMTGDFAVLEFRNGGRRPCEMRSEVSLTALGGGRHPLREAPVLRSHPARPAIVLGSLSAGPATLKQLGELDGLGIFVTGGNESDRGGCTGTRLIRPAFWRVTMDRVSQVISNNLGERNVAQHLATCMARGSGFAVSRQTANADLPVEPRPS